MKMLQSEGSSVARQIADEISAAARCGEFLEQMGLEIAFRGDATNSTVNIELRSASGGLLRRLRPEEFFRLIALDLEGLESWVFDLWGPRIEGSGA